MRNLLSRVVEIVTSEMPAAKKSRRGKRSAPYHRGLHLESLENRELLAVTLDDFAQIRDLYADLNLSENIGYYNVIELTAANLSVANLKAAIATAGTTTESDLIVVRTTALQNTITYASAADELSININATNFGSVTIVGFGDTALTIDAVQKSRVMSITSSTVALAGLTITGGSVAGSGGGISSSGSNSVLTVTNSTISGNAANGTMAQGGGIYSYGSNGILTVTNCTISENTSGSGGGGIYSEGGSGNNGSTLTVTNCIVTKNTSGTGGNNGSGGGIYGYYCKQMAITDSMISENIAMSNGGGIYTENGTLTVTNSTIDKNTATASNSSDYGGGGVYTRSTTVTVTSCTISENTTAARGGGINSDGSLTIRQSTISGNTAGKGGGGVYSGGTLMVQDCTISDNTTSGSAGGGGIYSYTQSSALFTVTDSTISGNKTISGTGGGIAGEGYNSGGISVTNCIISGNTAGYDGGSNSGGGGGIFVNASGTALTVTDCAITNNLSASSGGGISSAGGMRLIVANSTISGNKITVSHPLTYGGGIYSYSGIEVTNSQIIGNSSTYHGGGIYISSYSGATITNSTIAGNSAVSNGGGMYTFIGAGAFVVTNSTISGNTSSSGGGIYSSGAFTLNNTIVALNSTDIYCNNGITGSNNIISKGENQTLVNGANSNLVGTAANPVDPKFVKIPTVIGATTTGANYNPSDWDLRIMPSSPALNGGNNALAAAAGLTATSQDLAGMPRIIGDTIDIGAYEYFSDCTSILFNQTVSGKTTATVDANWYTFTADAGTTLSFDLLAGSYGNYTVKLYGALNKELLSNTGTFTLIEAGTYFIEIKAKNSYAGNYTFRVSTHSAQVLTPNVTFTGTMPASQYAKLFQTTTTTGGALEFNLGTASGVRAEIYVQYGSAPTRTNYAYQSTSGKVLVEYAPAGTYYILVYGDYVPTSGAYTLTAKTASIVLTDYLQTGTNPNSLEFTISGAAFDNTVKAWLVSKSTGNAVLASSTFVTSSAKMVATFSGTFNPGDYTLRLQKGAMIVNSQKSYTVVANAVYDIKTKVIAPDSLGNRAMGTLYIEYTNNGNTTVAAPLISFRIVSRSTNEERAKLTLDSANIANGLWTSTMPNGFSNSIQILGSGATAGVLQPGETVRIPIYWAGWDGALESVGFECYVNVISPNNTDKLNLVALKQSIRGTGYTDAAWEIVWSRLQSVMGTTWGSYVGMLDNVAAYLNSIGRNVRNIDELFAVAVDWANDASNPFGTLVATNDLSVAGRDFVLNFSRSFIGSTISSRFTQAQMGYGWDHNWNWSLDIKANGNVVLLGPQNSQRLFQPDARAAGKYISASLSATATLVKQGTNYIYTEQDGTVYTFGSDGKLQKCTDQYGNEITFTHTAGKLTKIADAQGNFITLTYNASGNITKSLDSQGNQVNYAYDTTGKYLISAENKYGQKILYDYNKTGNTANSLKSITYPDGTVQQFTYDSLGTLTGSQISGLEAVRIVRGSTAKTLQVYETYVGNTLIGKTYLNELGQVSRAEDTQGRSTNYYYDSLGRLSKSTDAVGVSVSYKYDAKGNLIGYTGAQGDSLGFKYDSKGQLLQLTDALGHKTLFTYDAFGNVKEMTRQDGTKNTYTYDANGFLTEKTTRADDKYTYVYDAKGRLIEMRLSTATKSMRYEYDANDNVIKIIDTEDRVTLQEYNDRNWLTKVTQPDGRYLVYTYDSFGRRTSISDGGSYHITYSYNALGFLEYVRNGKDNNPATNLITQYFYDNRGNITKELQGNGTYTSYVYDSLGYMTSKVTYNSANVILASFAYVYGARGGITTMTTLDGTWSYNYDLSGQLIGSQFFTNNNNPALTSVEYVWAYDAAGNRVSQSVNGATTTYDVNAMNQIVDDGTYTYEYNANGTLVKKTDKITHETWTYTWCQGSWLYSVESSTGEKWEYDYDPYGNRTMVKHTNALGVVVEEFRYVYDISGLGSITAVYDGARNLLASYAYGYGLVSQTDASGNAAYYGFDHLGSTAVMTGANGDVVNQYAYDPFGGSLYKNETSTLDNPFQFVGEYGVATNQNDSLISMRARWYDPALGRFVSEDPLGLDAGDDNLYRYAANSPLLHNDPSGEIIPVLIWGGMIAWGAWGFGSAIGKTVADAKICGIGTALKSNAADLFLGAVGLFGAPGKIAQFGKLGSVGKAIKNGYVHRIVKYKDVNNMARANVKNDGIGMIIDKITSEVYKALVPPCNAPLNPTPPHSDNRGDRAGGSPAIQSVDPNEIRGPNGYGDKGWITGTETLAYEIHFENDSKATAPAQRVDIEQYLDPNLDWSSLEFTGFGFGDVYIALAAGQHSVNQIVEMTVTPLGSTESQTIYVEVTAGIDLKTGRVYASFQTLQYVTLDSFDDDFLLPPLDVNIGFLLPSILGSDDQPIDNRGMGFINYVVKAKNNLVTDDTISSVAKIQFDLGEIIYTNQIDPHDPSKGTDPKLECPLTIDAAKPTSAVTAFASGETTDSRFTVTWSGTDIGSGVARYDVYVSVNGGAFTKWLDKTALTSAAYQGEAGRTYAFYSIAYDNVGLQEAKTAASEASVKVTSVATTELVAPVISDSSATGTTSIQVTWNSVAGATQYIVTYSYTTGTGNKAVATTKTGFVAAMAGDTQTAEIKGLDKTNTTYTITVTAVNATEKSAASTAVTVKTATKVLAAPKIAKIDVTKAGVATESSIKISWNKIDKATGYLVEWSTDGVEWTTVTRKEAATSITETVSGLQAGTTYYFRVTATGNEKTPVSTDVVYVTSVVSAVQSAATKVAPVSFKELTLTPNETDKVLTLAWAGLVDANPKVTGYVIQVCLKSDFKTLVSTQTVLVSEANNYSLNLANLTTGKEYFVRIKAVGAGYESSWQTTDKATAPASIKLQPPVITVKSFTDTKASISWNKPTGADKMTYEVKDSSGTVVKSGTGTSVSLTGLSANKQYTIIVTAEVTKSGSVYVSSEAATYTFTTAKTALKVPTKLEVKADAKPIAHDANPTLTVTWKAPTDTSASKITKYVIEYSTDPKFGTISGTITWSDLSKLEVVIGTGGDNGILLPATKYSIRVKAVANDTTYGESAWVTKANVTTAKQQLIAPANTNIDTVTATTMKVTWDWTPAINTTGNGYKVFYSYVDVKGATKTASVAVKAGVNEAVLKSLKTDTVYKVWVVAVGKGNNADSAIPADADKAPQKTLIAAPAGLSLSATSTTTITAKWSAVKIDNVPLANYEVQYKLSTETSWGETDFTPVAELTALIPDLTANTKYDIRVRAISGSESGDWSLSKSATTKRA